MSTLEVLAVASEIFPLIKTGGLADVVGALPAALAAEGVRVRTLIPGYPAVMAALGPPDAEHAIGNLFGRAARLLEVRSGKLDLFVLDAPHWFARPGNPYLGANGRDWPDNAERFAALARVGADIAIGTYGRYRPDIVHAHDWQAGLTHAYLAFAPPGPRPVRVFTVHNLAFQGQFSRSILGWLGLPQAAFSISGIEYFGDVGYLKSGLFYADHITTVSPTYATEIRTAQDGMGLEGLLQLRGGDLTGILNGIDMQAWDPQADPFIAARFSAAHLAARTANKADLQTHMGLPRDPAAPLFGVVSRLTWQKGIDMVLEALPALLDNGGQMVVLGTGDAALEARLREATRAHPGRIGCIIGYDEQIAHKIQAGADALLIPSRFEPCGLTQLYALRYGTVPVVARVGGLADTIIDANPVALAAGVATGLQFAPVTAEMLRATIQRAALLYHQPAIWQRMQINGMTTDVSWRDPARRYAALFRELTVRRA